jgi:hypothetical protein
MSGTRPSDYALAQGESPACWARRAAARPRCCAPSPASSRCWPARSGSMARWSPAPRASRCRPSSAHRHGVPGPRAVPAPHVAANIAFGLRGRAPAPTAARAGDAGDWSAWPAAAQRYPARAVRRPAAARGAGAGAGAATQLLLLDEPFSNLDVELRERLGWRTARDPQGRRHHRAAGHARPARGLRHRRRDRHHARGPHPAVGHAPTTCTTSRPTASSPTSSARAPSCPARCSAASTSRWNWARSTAPSRSAAPSTRPVRRRLPRGRAAAPRRRGARRRQPVTGRGAGQGLPRRGVPLHPALDSGRRCCRWCPATTTTPSASASASAWADDSLVDHVASSPPTGAASFPGIRPANPSFGGAPIRAWCCSRTT